MQNEVSALGNMGDPPQSLDVLLPFVFHFQSEIKIKLKMKVQTKLNTKLKMNQQ